MFHHQKVVKKRMSKAKKVGLFGFLFALLLLAGVIAGGRIWYVNSLKPLSSSLEVVSLTIEEGATPLQIGNQLVASKLIKNAKAFEWYVRFSGLNSKLKAGTYSLRPSQSVNEIAAQIADGKVTTMQFTIVPGKTLEDIKKLFVKAGFKEDAVEKALDPSYYSDLPALSDKPPLASLEGYLYPETFVMTETTTPNEIIKLSLDEMNKRLTPALRASFAKQGLSVHEAITLASIVEKEVNNPDDRRQVAQVFLKRLKMGMALGSDVTYHYAAKLLNVEATPFIDSPYNTRKYSGLPPGPISNVSITALEAVANPSPGDYLYFVAGDDGKTYFSKTNEEHEALTKEHCKVLCATY